MRRLFIGMLALSSALSQVAAPRGGNALNLVVLVDVTASRHRCPEGVAGLPSSTPAGSLSNPRNVNDRRLIPPAVEPFDLRGVELSDRIRAGALAGSVLLSEPVSGEPDALRAAWQSVFALPPVNWLGPSPIFDGLFAVLELLGKESGNGAIILVTDGLATGNARTSAEVITMARSTNVKVYVVGEETILSLSPLKTLASAINKDPFEPLRKIVTASGGIFVPSRPLVTPGLPCVERTVADAFQLALKAAKSR